MKGKWWCGPSASGAASSGGARKPAPTTRKKSIPTMQYKIFSIPILNGEEEKTKAGIQTLRCVCWGRQKPEKPLAEDGAAPCCQTSILVL